jgi:hypothetical protein
MSKARKPFWHIDEALERWELTERDLAAFVIADELTLSTVVAGVHVQFGSYEQVGPGELTRVPEGHRYVIGTIDIERDDAWRVLREDAAVIRMAKAERGSYMQICADNGEWLTVRRADLVVCRAEMERFERIQGIAHRPEAAAQRGAPPRFDWDRFWVEVCRVVHEDGLPRTQSALITRMSEWFDRNEPSSPDESTIKKKLRPLWHTIRTADSTTAVLEVHQ